MKWNLKIAERIISALTAKQPHLVCPSCQHDRFGLVDGFFVMPLSEDPSTVSLGGQVIPTVILSCHNCAHLLTYALLALGISIDELRALSADEQGVIAHG